MGVHDPQVDPTPYEPTHSFRIRKPVAGRALPAPVGSVWGVYDPHPFSCLFFDPLLLPTPMQEASHSRADHCQRCERNHQLLFHCFHLQIKKSLPYLGTYFRFALLPSSLGKRHSVKLRPYFSTARFST